MRILCSLLLGWAATGVAHASMIFSEVVVGAGFGSAPRILTVQGKGNASTESGCDSWSGIQTIVGPSACSNLANLGGDEPNPYGFPKDSTPTLASLGFAGASNIGIVLDATEPGNGGNSLTIKSLILKFFSGSGVLLLSESLAKTPLVLDHTGTGNGKTDFLFVLDQNGINQVTNTIFSAAGWGEVRIGLETTMTNVHGGPESFLAVDPPGPSGATPEPASITLIACGLVGLAVLRRRAA